MTFAYGRARGVDLDLSSIAAAIPCPDHPFI